MDLSIVSTGHDVADARLHRLLAAAHRAGLTTEIIALGNPDDIFPYAEGRTKRRAGMLNRAGRALLWPWLAKGAVVLTCDPDTTPAAWLSTRLRGRRWVADVHEDYAALLTDRSWVPRPLRRVLVAITQFLSRWTARADCTWVADDHVPPHRARRRLVVRNEPDLTMLPPLPAIAGNAAGPAGGVRYRAIYIGDLRHSRGLRTMVEAVAATHADVQAWELDLIGPMAEADRAWFSTRVRDEDAHWIRWHGRHTPRNAWAFAEGADLGLCLLADTPAFREALPSKIYEYLGCGIPVLTTPLPRVKALLENDGSEGSPALFADDTDAVTAVLRRFAHDHDLRSNLRRSAHARGTRQRRRENGYDAAIAVLTKV